MAGKKAQALSNQFIDQNPIEAVRNTLDTAGSGGAGNALVNEGNAIVTSLFDQMLGIGSMEVKNSGDMQEGQAIDLSQGRKQKQQEQDNLVNLEQKKQEKAQRIEAGWDYAGEIIHAGERSRNQENHTIEQQIQAILYEIQKLINSSEVLAMEFEEVAVTEIPVNAGKYHVNFFEWVLSVIKVARMKVEDSNAWMQTVKGKGAKKDYWGMFKKHGTSFGLSGERTAATQAG